MKFIIPYILSKNREKNTLLLIQIYAIGNYQKIPCLRYFLVKMSIFLSNIGQYLNLKTIFNL